MPDLSFSRFLFLLFDGRFLVDVWVSVGGEAGAFGTVDCSWSIFTDTSFSLIDFIGRYDAYISARRLAAMHTNHDSTSVWDVLFQRNCEIFVGTYQERWSQVWV